MDWPVVGVAKNCHDFGCSPVAVPVLIYRSTITFPLIEFVPPTTPTAAVPALLDTRVILSPVFKIALAFPKDNRPVNFKVSFAAEDTVTPLPVLFTTRFLIVLFSTILPASDCALGPFISIVPIDTLRDPLLFILPAIFIVPITTSEAPD